MEEKPPCITRGMGFQEALKQYFRYRKSVPSMFISRIAAERLQRLGLSRAPKYLRELSFQAQYRVLMNSLWEDRSDVRTTYPDFFRKRVYETLQSGHLNRIKQWFYTADGLVVPILLAYRGAVEHLPVDLIDRVTKWALVNCANDYAGFISSLKRMKKRLRKSYALGQDPVFPRNLARYREVYDFVMGCSSEYPEDWKVQFEIQHLMLVTQSRATGLADAVMMSRSLKKFRETVSQQYKEITLDTHSLMSVTAFARKVKGTFAKSSAGPAGALQVSRENGGQTRLLSDLCRTRINYTYDTVTLSRSETEFRRISKVQDVLDWAIEMALTRPTVVRMCRTHVVAEPSKARVITIAHYAYTFIMHIFSHLWKREITDQRAVTGLRGSRNLWEFLKKDLDPQEILWEEISPEEESSPVYALSTDLEEATDYGNPSVARQIWNALIAHSQWADGFPTGLAILAKNLFCGKRYILRNDPGVGSLFSQNNIPLSKLGDYLFVKRRGWLMGDPMTKVILTLAQVYALEKSQLRVAAINGDDLIALSIDREKLERYPAELESLDFKVSLDDTYVSRKIMFYCEEVARVPQDVRQTIAVQFRRSETFLWYIDYPRIRLLLPVYPDNDRYSYNDTGRFDLLGKEMRWTYSLSRGASIMMQRAVLLQHLMVPAPAGSLRFLPIELGGDGSFTPDPTIVVASLLKTEEPLRSEKIFRMRSLMRNRIGYRYLRSDRNTILTHRHTYVAPTLAKLRDILPENMVVTGVNQYHRNLLACVRTFVSPWSATMTLAHTAFYRALFRGARFSDLPSLTFDIVRELGVMNHQEFPSLWEISTFLKRWMNPGFNFRDEEPFLIDSRSLEVHQYMNFGWTFERSRVVDDHIDTTFDEYITRNESLVMRDAEGVLDALRSGRSELPRRVMDRLPLFMESDNLILWQLHDSDVKEGETVVIVTRDLRLAAKVRNMHRLRVYAIVPSLWLIGRLFEVSDYIPHFREDRVIEDPGSILYEDSTYFELGMPRDARIFDAPIVRRVLRSGVFLLTCAEDEICGGSFPAYTDQKEIHEVKED